MVDALGNRGFFLTSVEVFFLVTLNVLSLTGNLLVCIAVYQNARLRTTTNLYIIALAVSDLMSVGIKYSLTTNFRYKVYRGSLNFGILHEF